jgi:hypothetical protein
MKAIRFFLCILLSGSLIESRAQKNNALIPVVDKRVELLSVLARLAEYPEYSNNTFKIYASDVDRYFEKYKTHEAVQFMKFVRSNGGVGYDAVMFMAIHLTPELQPAVEFTDMIPEKRWGRENALKFAVLAKKFYEDSKFDAFLNDHKPLYAEAVSKMKEVTGGIDLDWYYRFYGSSEKTNFNLIIGLLNGGGNFGPKLTLKNREELYAIIGTWIVDSTGMPDYKKASSGIIPTLVHEFNHSFINPLVYKNELSLKGDMDTVFNYVKGQMKKLAYEQSIIMICESLVRAAVSRYLMEQGTNASEYMGNMLADRNRGFIWMPELFALLGVYETNRKRYKTFESFMPEVTGYYADLAKRIDELSADVRNRSVKVKSIDAFENGSTEVDTGVKKVSIFFSRPVDPRIRYSFSYGPKGKLHYPVVKNPKVAADGTHLSFEVALKPDWDYEFILNEDLYGFINPEYPLISYPIHFKTKK